MELHHESPDGISGLGQGRMLSLPEGRRLVFDVAKEAGEVARAAAVKLEPLTFLGVDPRQLVGDPETRRHAERTLLERYSSQMDKSFSMSQDIERGRRRRSITSTVSSFRRELSSQFRLLSIEPWSSSCT